MADLSQYLVVGTDVAAALRDGKPVVALESTIISHGMKYPENLETALRVENTVREGGAVPATIAVLDGKIRVGLTRDEIEVFAKKGTSVKKCSQRELPFVLATGGDGALTVAATMLSASLVGISVFVTGGIGGVHRGYEETLDVSNDLHALATIPVTVVCAGAKSILDIPRTLESLETLGVPVVVAGSTAFPAFFTPDSGLPAPARVDDPAVIAGMMKAARALGLRSGLLVAVPVPASVAAEAAPVEEATNQALEELRAANIRGQEATPFLLRRIAELTGGESLRANIELVLNNARFGTRIATSLTQSCGSGST